MAREHETQVAELLYQALELPPQGRDAFLAQACAGNVALREEVQDLLLHQADDSFLEPAESIPVDRQSAPLPERIGPFRPLAVLGFGGMGVVYEAQQDHPQRRVALKVLRITQASSPAIQRFVQEGQALARLHHPGIVPIFEAGTASLPEGQVPYFAMELVEGQRLDRFLQGRQLATPERLELFLRICDAVAHAHDKGVIHRDLKPANILVESSGQPRILDFGVARLLDADVPTTLRTAAGMLLGTIGYMSPEQAAGAPEPVDRRCDVYSLGVMLYELLCGSHPFRVAEKSLPEALRIVREDQPLPLRSVARALAADLEVIAHKCIEKDPRRRYASVGDLASDVRRHLRGESIAARPPDALTQMSLFVRRNRRAVVSAGLVVTALSIGLVAALDQRNEARRERDQAQQMLAAFEHMLTLPDPELGMRHDATVRELLDSSASGMLAALKDDPELEARLGRLLGRTYFGLGDFKRARELLAPALAYYSATLGPEDPLTLSTLRHVAGADVRLGQLSEAEAGFRSILAAHLRAPVRDAERIAEFRSLLADTLQRKGAAEEAEALMQLAAEDTQRELGPDHPWTLRVGTGYAAAVRDPQRSEALLRQSISEHERVYGPGHLRTVPALELLAGNHLSRSEFVPARTLYEQVYNWRLQRQGPDHPETIDAQDRLANCMWWLDDYAAAEATARPLLATTRRVLGPDHRTTLDALALLASSLANQRKLEEALPLCEEAALETARVLGPMHVDTLNAEQTLGEACWWAKNYARAESILQQVAQSRAETLGEADTSTLNSRRAMVGLLIEQGRAQDAEARARELLGTCERERGTQDAYTTRAVFLLADALFCGGKLEDAEKIVREHVVRVEETQGAEEEASLALRRDYEAFCGKIERTLALESDRAIAASGAASEPALIASFRRGRVLVRARRFEEAEELAQENLQLAREHLPAGHPVRGLLQGLLGFCYLEAGDLAHAEPELVAAYDAMCASLGPESGTSHNTAALLVQLYETVGRQAEAERFRALTGAK